MKSGRDLGRAMERNQSAWFELQGEATPGVELTRWPDVGCLSSPRVHDPNVVFSPRFAAEGCAERIEAVLAIYRAVRRPAAWYVDADAEPADLRARLHARGVRCRYQLDGMAAALDAAPPPAPLPDGVRIEVGGGYEPYARHPHPWGGTGPGLRRFLAASQAMDAARPETLTRFTAWRGDVPVGSAVLYVHDGVAGVYDVGVIEAERRRGIGSALTRAVMEAGRDAGCWCAALSPSELGRPVYERLGFRTVCSFAIHYYSLSSQQREAAAGNSTG